MALGGAAGLPMIAAFLWLGGCYAAFALGALRPAAISSVAVAGYLVTATGDVLLAFPTDAPGQPASWHGALHLAGVIVATAGTLIVAGGLLRGDRRPGGLAPDRPGRRRWSCSRRRSASPGASGPGGRRWSTSWASRRRRSSCRGACGGIREAATVAAASPEPGLADRLREVPARSACSSASSTLRRVASGTSRAPRRCARCCRSASIVISELQNWSCTRISFRSVTARVAR